jgi:hypothetical protein
MVYRLACSIPDTWQRICTPGTTTWESGMPASPAISAYSLHTAVAVYVQVHEGVERDKLLKEVFK